jgi:glycine cleavage system H protein
MSYPTNYRYTKQHEWIEANGNGGVARIGITDFAQKQVGDVVFVGLPKVGATFKAGEELATIESTKAVFEVFAPVGCEVLELNTSLESAPEKVNADPQGEAWFAKVRIVDPNELSNLMDAAAYEAFCPECQT